MSPSVFSMPATGVISLAELMSHHRDFLVEPICWTSRHLEILGCRFEHLDHVPADDIEPNANTSQPIDDGKKLEKRRGVTPTHEEIFATARYIMSREDSFEFLVFPLLNRKCERPHFFFANKRIHRPQYNVFYRSRKRNQRASQAPRPMIGYLDYRDVEDYRQKMFPARCPPDGLTNRPGGRIRLKRIAQITPKNWSEDPYLLCVLLSLAQLQEYHRKESHPPIHIVSALLITPPAFSSSDA
ncbi:unnamed protein product [Penicillium glandicola]